MESNLHEQPMKSESKFKETLEENIKFIRGLFYLTRKVFML